VWRGILAGLLGVLLENDGILAELGWDGAALTPLFTAEKRWLVTMRGLKRMGLGDRGVVG
jgi:hypothetical protein